MELIMPRPSKEKNEPGPTSFPDPHDILMSAPIGIFTSTPEGRFLSANPAMARMYGYDSPDDMVKSVTDIARQIYVNPADRFQLYHMLENNEAARNFESLQKRKNGSTFWAMESVQVIRNKDGSVGHVQGFITDISGQIQTDGRQENKSLQAAEQPGQDERHDRDVEIELENIIDRTAVQQLMSDFCELTGIGGALLDLKGNVLASTGWEDICIKFHRAHPETNRYCMESDMMLSQHVRPGEYKIYRCKNNMLDIVMPIMVEGRHAGNLFTGQFFFEDEPPDHQVFKDQAGMYGFDEKHYLAALKKVPLLDKDTVTRALRFYVNLAEIISTMGYNNVKLKRNLAEREDLLESLRTSEEMFRSISENIFALIAIIDSQGHYTYCNASYSSILGYDPKSLIGTDCFAVVHHDHKELALDLFQQGLGYKSRHLEFVLKLIARDGSTKWVEHRASILPDSQGNPGSILLLAQDVTDRLQAEKEIRKFKTVIDQAVHGTAISDLRGNLIYVNDYFAGIHGYTSDELIGQRISVFHTGKQMEEVRKILDSSMGTGQFTNAEVWHVHKDGTEFPTLMSGVVIKDEQGVPEFLAATAIDITDRKRAEEKVESEGRLRNILLDNLPNCIALIINKQTREIVASNKTAAKKGAVPGKTCFATCAEREDECPFCLAPELWSTNQLQKLEVEYRGKWYEGVWAPFNDDLYIHYIFDITDHKRAEEALIKSEQRLSEVNKCLLSLGPDFDGNIEKLTALCGKLLGADCALYNRLEGDLLCSRGQWHAPQDYDPRDNPEGHICYDVIQKGSNSPVVISNLQESPYAQTDPNVIGYGLRTYIGQAVRRGEGYVGSICAVFQKDVVLSEDEHRVIGLIASALSAEESRIQAEEEREKLQSQLLQARKMESIGMLAGGIAHDFNNLLHAMGGNLELLNKKLSKNHPGKKRVKTIQNSMDRAAQLVKKLLLFSRKADIKTQVLDLNREIHDALKLLERSIPKMVNIELILDENAWPVNADPIQVEQVLLNLGTNAAHAMPEGGRLIIETANAVLDHEFVRTHTEAIPGKYVLITASDTGTGMDRETLQHVFDPFFTTKEVDKGTGLGLASVFGIVKAHDGYIICYSEPGQGTAFKIYWPAAEPGKIEPGEIHTEQSVLQDGTETILLVDDDEQIRELTSEVLEDSGYQVIIASSGEQALEVFRKKYRDIDLVLMDLNMPGMGGSRCTREMITLDPSVRVLVASGYSANVHGRDVLEFGAEDFISKPYQMRELLAKIRELLDGK
jgi:two-component system, cell cycle sensor histidine kinase and response regulator CckA